MTPTPKSTIYICSSIILFTIASIYCACAEMIILQILLILVAAAAMILISFFGYHASKLINSKIERKIEKLRREINEQ